MADPCQLPQGIHCNLTSNGGVLVEDFLAFCPSVIEDRKYYNIQAQVIHCVQCFYSNRCLDNNTCAKGATGETCEQCLSPGDTNDTGYYAIGSSCVECDSLPITSIFAAIFFVLVVCITCYNGFTISICTKLKQIITFGQLVLLTLSARVPWPGTLTSCLKYFSIFMANSAIATPVCLGLNPMVARYIEWMTSLLLPVLCFLITWAIDAKFNQLIKKYGTKESKKWKTMWKYRSMFRRGFVFLFLTWYTPMAVSVIHSNACVSNVPKELTLNGDVDSFLLDQRQSCDDIVFQGVNFISTVYLVLIILPVPPVYFFAMLCLRKWKSMKENQLHYGAWYESFKERFCFWETIPLLRKLVHVVATEIYPLGSLVETAGMLSVSMVYMVVVTAVRPYSVGIFIIRGKIVNVHNLFEVMSSLALALLQAAGLLLTTRPDLYVSGVNYMVLGTLMAVILFWLATLFITPWEADIDGASDTLGPSVIGAHSPVLRLANTSGEGIEPTDFKECQSALHF